MIQFMTFDKSAAEFIAESLGFVVKGKRLYTSDGKRRVICGRCSKGVTTRNLGGFVKVDGMDVVCCDNPVCVTETQSKSTK